MNDIRKRVLTFDPVVLVTQEGQPDILPSPLSPPGRNKGNNHGSKAMQNRKADGVVEKGDASPESKTPSAALNVKNLGGDDITF